MSRRQVITDDELLSFITLRVEGHSSYEISDIAGIRAPIIRTATNRVRDADIEHCGEHVAGAYW